MNKNDNKLIIESPDDSSAVSISRDKLEVKKSGNLVIGSLNLVLDPLKKRNELYYKKNRWYLWIDILVLFLLAALVVFLFFNNRWQTTKKVDLSLSSQSSAIVSGNLETFEFKYFTHIDAKNSALEVFLPENFIIESVQPANLFDYNNNTFNLGDLDYRSSGNVKISGFVWGNKDDQQRISSNFSCSLCGRNGISSSLFYNIEKQAIDLNFDIGDWLYADSEFEAVIKLKNNTNNIINDLIIDFGSDIEIRHSDFSLLDKKINIKEISSQEELEFSLWAFVKKNDNLILEPKINFSINDKNFSYHTAKRNFIVREPGLSISAISERKNISEGELITYNINYKNQDPTTIKNINIDFLSANPNFNIKTITAKNYPSGSTFSGRTLTIEDLISGESGTFQVEVSFDRRQFTANQEVFLQINLDYEIEGQHIRHRTTSTKNKVKSEFYAIAKAYYYSPQGDQLGVGPLPPAINMATNYWIFLEFNNLGNDLNDFVLSAELPANVYFADSTRVLDGNLMYGEIGKRVVWEIPNISGSSGKYRANFELTLIPEDKDLGRVPNLLENIRFNARDVFLDTEISGTLNSINTDLKNDRLSSGKGQVIEIR